MQNSNIQQDENTQPPTAYVPPAMTVLGSMRQMTRGWSGAGVDGREMNHNSKASTSR